MELVLPGAYYYVQMQDGRIYRQGKVHELRQKGILEEFRPELIAEEPEEDTDTAKENEVDEDAGKIIASAIPGKDGKRPRKLVQEETRQTGSVQKIIYETYIKAT